MNNSLAVRLIQHDTMNALTLMKNYLVFALEQAPADTELQANLNSAYRMAERLHALIKEVYMYHQHTLESVKIKDVICDSIACRNFVTVSNGKVSIQVDVPDNLYMVHGSKMLLTRVVDNLILNGIEAMPEGGLITVVACNEEIKADKVASPSIKIPPGKYLKLTITDNGVGISESDLSLIFSGKYTTKKNGNGIALHIIQAILHDHGGNILVRSKVGCGTSFDIYLPSENQKQNFDPSAFKKSNRIKLGYQIQK